MIRLSVRSICLVAFVAACHGDHDHGTDVSADEFFYDCEQRPDLAVFATDEAFIAVVNAEAAGKTQTVDDERAPRLQSPAPGSTLSVSTPPKFVVATAAASRAPLRGRPCLNRPRTFWTRAAQSLSPIGTAHAHCPAVSGPLYLLRVIRDSETRPVYSALAAVTEISPSSAVWTKVMKGRTGQTLKVSLARVVLSKGTVTEGPFLRPAQATFTVSD